MDAVKIGMISFAHPHAYSYARAVRMTPGAELVAVADDGRDVAATVAKRFDAVPFTDYEDLLKQELDAVIICSENARHAELVVAAAQAGKHVMCEKPIATTVEDGWRMINACKAHGVKLQTAFPVRYNQPVRRAKQLIDSGRLGRILAVQGTNRGQNPGRWFIRPELSGGGAVLDHTVHVVDVLRWYLNSEVRSVYAEIDNRFGSDSIDDCGLLMLQFDNGVLASHDPSWSRCKSFPTWGDVTLEIVGTEGVTRVDATAQHLLAYDDATGRHTFEPWGDDFDLLMVRDFIECVRDGREPFITGEDGLRAMEVALAAYESARTGQPVTLEQPLERKKM